MKANESVDFFSVHSREEVAEIDKRIERKQKEYEAKLIGADENNISQKLKRAEKKLRENYKDRQI